MKFLAITLIVHAPDPITGVQKSTTDRFREVIGNAQLAEELGFDGFGVGERHERPFISAPAPPPPRRCGTASTSRMPPSASATPGTGSPSTTSTPASPGPPRPSSWP
jgi:alkanesulfonate monooxygenase SsuD/methylene tetrahydromethanopterin reductase-like flavin-dependent oxidoreductase (luciferase family)